MLGFNSPGGNQPSDPFLDFIRNQGVPQPFVIKELPDPAFVRHLREVGRLEQEAARQPVPPGGTTY